jgi:hypothetical protein
MNSLKLPERHQVSDRFLSSYRTFASTQKKLHSIDDDAIDKINAVLRRKKNEYSQILSGFEEGEALENAKEIRTSLLSVQDHEELFTWFQDYPKWYLLIYDISIETQFRDHLEYYQLADSFWSIVRQARRKQKVLIRLFRVFSEYYGRFDGSDAWYNSIYDTMKSLFSANSMA